MRQTFLEAGKVRNTHALSGEVKLECYLDGAADLKRLKHLYPAPSKERELILKGVRAQGDIFLVRFAGIDTVEKAALLKGKTLYAARSELDPDGTRIYYADLLALPLIEEGTGRVYGTVTGVSENGAGTLFTVALPDGREAYFPAVRAWIVRMDPEKGVFVHAPEGIFD